jgi:DNA replication and repair protein RecF
MIIHTLELSSYRNYSKTAVVFGEKINVFVGENAQGKTNLLEAIYVVALAKSRKTYRRGRTGYHFVG